MLAYTVIAPSILATRKNRRFRQIPVIPQKILQSTTDPFATLAKHCQNQPMSPQRSPSESRAGAANSPARRPASSHPAKNRVAPLDDTAKAIIELLQSDGRRSYAEIGKTVGLSEAAIRQRVQKLTDAGIIQIVAVTDPMQLGFNRQAMIGVRVSGDSRTVADSIASLPEVDYVVLTAGSFDILAEVICENDDELIALLNSKIRILNGVLSTETFVYLKLRKQLYNWGTR